MGIRAEGHRVFENGPAVLPGGPRQAKTAPYVCMPKKKKKKVNSM
jgi:hypothetical protein